MIKLILGNCLEEMKNISEKNTKLLWKELKEKIMEQLKPTEIAKCRAKDLKTGEWIYGYIMPPNDEEFLMVCVDETGCTSSHNIIQDTICSFTGVCDANGTPIYQHDKVSRISKRGDVLYTTIEEVIFSKRENAWMAGEFKRLTPKSIANENIRIKGNIFDN